VAAQPPDAALVSKALLGLIAGAAIGTAIVLLIPGDQMVESALLGFGLGMFGLLLGDIADGVR
jgi:hypothetical protein